MRAAYVLIVLGFFRRLLRKVLVPSGGHREYVEGDFRIVVERRECFHLPEQYWLKGFGGRWQVGKMRRELRELGLGKLPYGWVIAVVEKTAENRDMLRTMKYWSMIPDRDVRDAVEEVDAWWDANRGRFM